MKSGKQRRAELDAKWKAKREKARADEAQVYAAKERAARAQRIAEFVAAGGLPVNTAALAENPSDCDIPDFVCRGYYLDLPFECMDCKKAEVWTAAQQKWWYETAKGDVFATARRCRACRRKQRERRAESRRVHQEGLARKRARRANVPDEPYSGSAATQ